MAGAYPAPATARAFDDPAVRAAVTNARRVHLVALGKAAGPMTLAATRAVAALGVRRHATLVVTTPGAPAELATADDERSRPTLVRGDHPIPGERSRDAASALARAAADVAPEDAALVLLSGGTTSLVAAPVDGVAPDDLTRLHQRLLASGLDIGAMNAVRRRFSRWGAGRLAAALSPARVVCLVVSDVIGDDVATIGSGPCAPDPLTARDVRRIVEGVRGDPLLPPSCAALLDAVERGEVEETPKPGDDSFLNVETRIVAGNRVALTAAAETAARRGAHVVVHEPPLAGEARDVGERLARFLLAEPVGELPVVHLWGGEPTVTLGERHGTGGRCQELALAAAHVLHEAGAGRVTLLAAGTDGRDGPTDAAGACVDATTWTRIASAGLDPSRALAAHDAHGALDAAGTLVRMDATGTNVGDVVVGVVG